LNIGVEIIGVETVRETSGLAMSSRNGYLTAAEKSIASLLYQSLCSAKETILATDLSFAEIEQHALTFLTQAGFQPDYFSICRADDLCAAKAEDSDLVLLTAAKLGKTRLIDNLTFSRK
jgi:pantoate--beta-alanine ligase